MPPEVAQKHREGVKSREPGGPDLLQIPAWMRAAETSCVSALMLPKSSYFMFEHSKGTAECATQRNKYPHIQRSKKRENHIRA